MVNTMTQAQTLQPVVLVTYDLNDCSIVCVQSLLNQLFCSSIAITPKLLWLWFFIVDNKVIKCSSRKMPPFYATATCGMYLLGYQQVCPLYHIFPCCILHATKPQFSVSTLSVHKILSYLYVLYRVTYLIVKLENKYP